MPVRCWQFRRHYTSVLLHSSDRAGSAKAVAQAAAVLGGDGFDVASLSTIVGTPELVIQEALSHLEAVGLLERRRVPSAKSWTFRHALLRETAYDSMLRDHRQLLHGRVADALASEEEPAILAHHLSAAGRIAESIPHYLSAARRSVAHSALQEAVRLLRRGLTMLETLPPTDTRQAATRTNGPVGSRTARFLSSRSANHAGSICERRGACS